MEYNKYFLSLFEQVELLEGRGLIIDNRESAIDFLSVVSYYRFSSYTLVFEEKSGKGRTHQFKSNSKFSDISKIYEFDHQLRIHTLKAIEAIEIAFRTRLCYELAKDYGSHWYENPSCFKNPSSHYRFLELVDSEISRSKEIFIKHYGEKYSEPKRPPSWMIIELLSIGTVSKLFQNLSNQKAKKRIATQFGLKSAHVLGNWLRSITICRNFCAHHSRIWNRRFSPITIPNKLKSKIEISYRYRDYLLIIGYLLNSIHRDSRWCCDLKALFEKADFIDKAAMGFVPDWINDVVWEI